jgi:excisionase family DNA binding protein
MTDSRTQLDSLPDLLTVHESAQYLRVSRNGLYKLIADGVVPSVRLGRRLVVPKAAIAALIEGGNR